MAWATRNNNAGCSFTLLTCLPAKGESVHLSFRTPQRSGHPHPALSRSTAEAPALLTTGVAPTELEARLHPALAECCGVATPETSDNIFAE